MARWGCVFGVLAVGSVVAAMRWSDGAAGWAGWCASAVFGWCTVMSVYSFDRPAPATNAARVMTPRSRADR
jgi:hypothetical protein